jgi:2-polyprenyl-3-methyl-5-hydroxy-6-metoxy-1,4-benzoquinol methylase
MMLASAAGVLRSTPGEARDLALRICSLPPYEAALAYRDLVRLEAPAIRDRLADPVVRKKYDNYLATYERSLPARHFTDHNYAQKLVPVLNLIRSSAVRTVMDAACGNGFEALLFALHGKAVHANDCTVERYTITSVRADYYRELVGPGLQLTVSASNVMDGAASLGAYDVVFVQEAISHIHPAEGFLALARERYLVPGGRLVVCDSNGWNPVTRARITRHLWAERRTVRHYLVEFVDALTGRRFLVAEERLFGPPTVRRMMRRAGLSPEQTWMSGSTPPPVVRHRGSRMTAVVERSCRALPVLRSLGGFYTIVARRVDRHR